MKILTEASGSLVGAFMINAIREAGYFSVGSDIRNDCHARFTSDFFIEMPRANDPHLWPKVEKLIVENNIDFVIPSLDETLLGWSERQSFFSARGIEVVISQPRTIEIFSDKWKTYQFFKNHGIPTPKSSLEPKFPLIKPRKGRGSEGINVYENQSERELINMEGCISQTIAKGREYTVDCLFSSEGQPIYVIPRRRETVSSGKSIDGIVDLQSDIIGYIKMIADQIQFKGPVNIQLFKNAKQIEFIEVNPRVAGGMALGFAASENWVPLCIDICNGKKINPKTVRDGMRMYRYYKEVFAETAPDF